QTVRDALSDAPGGLSVSFGNTANDSTTSAVMPMESASFPDATSHHCNLPAVAAASDSPSPEYAMRSAAAASAKDCSDLPSLTCQRRIAFVLSSEPAAKELPSGAKATLCTAELNAFAPPSRWPPSTSHHCMLPSARPAAMICESGEYARAVIGPMSG